MQRRGDFQLLSFSCDCNGGFSGDACEIPQVGLDECGCVAGQGWSTNGVAKAMCADGGHTSVMRCNSRYYTTKHL